MIFSYIEILENNKYYNWLKCKNIHLPKYKLEGKSVLYSWFVRFYADTCPEMNIAWNRIFVDNQCFIVLARQLTIYSRRRLTKTSSQNQEVITIKK